MSDDRIEPGSNGLGEHEGSGVPPRQARPANHRAGPSGHEAGHGPRVTPENSVLREQAQRAGNGIDEGSTSRGHASRSERQRTGKHPDEPGEEDWGSEGPHAPGVDGRQQASVISLLRSLAGDTATLTRKELALARSEVKHAVSEVKTGAVSAATGGGILYAGLLFLMLAATLGLATVMEGWQAALIVGGVVALIGLIMLVTGKKKLQARNLRPDRTVDAMRKDHRMLDRRTG